MSTPATAEPRISLLYVDDEPSLLEIGKIFLEKTGEFAVTTAESAAEAILTLKDQPFDAIISDYQMPGMDGIAFLKHVRSAGDTTPFIIFTGKGREDVVIQALNEGADFYLQKGGDPKAQFAELSNKVRYAVTRKAVEKALSESEERYRNVVEDQTEFICRFLPDGTHIFVNQAYCRRFDKKAEDLIGTRFKPVIHPDDAEEVTRLFASLTPDHPVGIIEQRVVLPDNEVVWDRWSTRAFFDDDGTLREYQSVGRDITEIMERDSQLQEKNEELTAAEEELRQQVEELSVARQEIEESREQLELAMDAGEHGFWDWNLLTNEAYFSPRYYTMLGYDPGEFPPGFESWLSLLHPDDREFVVPIVEGCVREMQPFEEDFRLRCKDGSWRWISGRGKIYQSKTGGHPTRALGVQVDIHDRKLTALALQKKNEELHAAYEQLTASEEELRHNLDELAGQELALRRKKTELEERYRFEELVRQIVSRFIKTDDFDQNITESLTDIGTYCGASRSYIFEFRGVEEVMDNTYEWCAENVSPEIDNLQNLPTTLFPWWMAHLRNGEMIHIPDISLLLPEASAEREILEPQGIKSIIILPLTIKERLIGFIGLDNVQGTEEWSDEAVALLRIYSDFLGNAFERRHNWRALQDQNRALLEAKEQIAASEEEIRTQLDEKIAIQHQLDLSEEQYRAIFEHTKTPAVIIDEDTSISLANSAFAAISGYSPEEVIGRSWTEFVSKSDLEVMISYRRKRREEGADSPTQYEFSFINRYGDPRNIHLTIGMLPGTRQLVASFHDITEPKQTEKALRESEEKYRLIAENTVDNIWIFDMDFRLSYISPSVLTMKGFTVEESLAQTAEEMMTPASYASLLARFNLEMELEATGTADPDRNVSFETEEYCKDGSTIKVENSTRLLRDDEGRPVGILGISRDITNRKAAEEALHTANKKLQLLSSITRHDIMNKIMTLHAYLDLTMPMIDDPILTGYLTEAEKAATAIQKQIEFTRIYENLGVHTPTWQPLSPLIEAIDHTRLPIHHDCGEFSVYADPMFEKVLQNLYDNTLRHAEGADCVRIRCEDQDGNLIITWEDNGPGVPEELKERIFDKIFGKNTGFGLFLSREILAITGITIAETGVFGEGARFEILVPGGAWRRSGEGTG